MISDAILIPKICARLQEIASNFSKFSGEAPRPPLAVAPSALGSGLRPPYRAPLSKIPGSAPAYALQNSTVFKSTQNWVGISDESRTDNGSEFHRIGPETAKYLWPYLVVLERGTTRSPRAAERRWPRLADSDTGEHSTVRYVDAAWRRQIDR